MKLVSVNRALQIADYRLVINATQVLRALFERPLRSYNPVRDYAGLLKGVIVHVFVLKWCLFSFIKGAVITVKWCLTGTKTRCSKWQRTYAKDHTIGKRVFEITASLLSFCQIFQKQAFLEFAECLCPSPNKRLWNAMSLKFVSRQHYSNWSDVKNGKKIV